MYPFVVKIMETEKVNLSELKEKKIGRAHV